VDNRAPVASSCAAGTAAGTSPSGKTIKGGVVVIQVSGGGGGGPGGGGGGGGGPGKPTRPTKPPGTTCPPFCIPNSPDFLPDDESHSMGRPPRRPFVLSGYPQSSGGKGRRQQILLIQPAVCGLPQRPCR